MEKEGYNFISVSKFNPIEYSNKKSLKVKVPKVRFDLHRSPNVRAVSDSPLKNHIQILHPTMINYSCLIHNTTTEQKSLKKLTPLKKKIKTVHLPIQILPKEKQEKLLAKPKHFLPAIKKPTVSEPLPIQPENSIYFELLGFFIKKHLDYNKLYLKIDCEHKGWIDSHDLTNYFYINEINCNIEETINSIFEIASMISIDIKILKRSFFAMCSAIEYDAPDDPKLLVGENLKKLHGRIYNFRQIFKGIATEYFISHKDILQACSQYRDNSTRKAIELVLSEAVDFARFLTCLPFFMWISSFNN